MEIPTLEQYTKAQSVLVNVHSWLLKCRQAQTELIDRLCEEREIEKTYMKTIEELNERVLIYETYERLTNKTTE